MRAAPARCCSRTRVPPPVRRPTPLRPTSALLAAAESAVRAAREVQELDPAVRNVVVAFALASVRAVESATACRSRAGLMAGGVARVNAGAGRHCRDHAEADRPDDRHDRDQGQPSRGVRRRPWSRPAAAPATGPGRR